MGAADQARTAIVEFSGPTPSATTSASSFEDPTAATHRFLAGMPGYQGWQWAVVVAAYPGADHATISEVVLVPGPTALLAPQWVPWEERVQPGDLSPGDLLAAQPTTRGWCPVTCRPATPSSTSSPARSGWAAARCSAHGAASTPHSAGTTATTVRVRRWPARPAGFAATAASISARRLAGHAFGVCGNEMSADGHVVAGEYGCGAHSDTPPPGHRLADVRPVRRRRARRHRALRRRSRTSDGWRREPWKLAETLEPVESGRSGGALRAGRARGSGRADLAGLGGRLDAGQRVVHSVDQFRSKLGTPPNRR